MRCLITGCLHVTRFPRKGWYWHLWQICPCCAQAFIEANPGLLPAGAPMPKNMCNAPLGRIKSRLASRPRTTFEGWRAWQALST